MRPAVRGEVAVVWLSAMGTDGNQRRLRQSGRGLGGGQTRGHLGQHGVGLARYINLREEPIDVDLPPSDVLTVDVEDERAVNARAGPVHDESLDRHIVQKHVLYLGRALDLDKVPAVLALLDDVRADDHAIVRKRGLVEHGGSGLDSLARGLDRRLQVRVILSDEDSSGKALVGEHADFGPLVEDHLLVWRCRLYQVFSVPV